jgi:predicted dehydrogenase
VADVLRLGVVGAGVVGQMRVRAARDCPGFAVAAVADPDLGAAARAARGAGASPLADYRELLARPDVDVVVVATPTPLHEEIAVAALSAGKHVLCEKPLAPTGRACRRILDAARRTGRTLAVGFNHRYLPPFRFLKDALDAGVIGRLAHVRALAGHAGLAEFRADWMYVGALAGGGAMMDVGIHMTDLIRFVAGEIEEVHGAATGGVWRVEGSEDDAIALMRSAAGVPIAYHATWTEWRGYTFRLEAYGEGGLIRAQYGPMLNEVVLRRTGGGRSRRWKLYPRANLRDRLLGWRATARRTFGEELRDFARMVAGERSVLADGHDGLRAVELAEAVYESSRRRAVVRLGSGA